MRLTRTEAVEHYGEDFINRLDEQNAEPTGRLIYPAFEPEHNGMDEYMASLLTSEDINVCVYYFIPSGEDTETCVWIPEYYED